MYPDGTFSDPKPFAKDRVWKRVNQFVAARRQEDGVRLIGTHSAEFDATNKAMRAGSNPANLVGSDPIIYWSAGPEVKMPRKPWWAFWSR
jgi:hypothetical protein